MAKYAFPDRETFLLQCDDARRRLMADYPLMTYEDADSFVLIELGVISGDAFEGDDQENLDRAMELLNDRYERTPMGLYIHPPNTLGGEQIVDDEYELEDTDGTL